MEKELIKVLERNAVYRVNLEQWGHSGEDKTEMVAAYSTIDDSYIGTIIDVVALCGRWGIAPQGAQESSTVSSIGFSKRNQKWYGWSHRALFGFGIGNITKEGDCQASSGYTDEYVQEHPEELEKIIPVGFECKTLDDCKRVAIAFAASVS